MQTQMQMHVWLCWPIGAKNDHLSFTPAKVSQPLKERQICQTLDPEPTTAPMRWDINCILTVMMKDGVGGLRHPIVLTILFITASGGGGAPDEISKTGISFHWDKDKDLRLLLGGSTVHT
jgi:hypothetical protein